MNISNVFRIVLIAITLLSCKEHCYAENVLMVTLERQKIVSTDKIALNRVLAFFGHQITVKGEQDIISIGSPVDAPLVEKKLIKYLIESFTNERVSADVVLDYYSYVIQFYPIKINGQSVVHIRAGSYGILKSAYKVGEPMVASDGGDSFWSTNYFCDKDTFSKLLFNGTSTMLRGTK